MRTRLITHAVFENSPAESVIAFKSRRQRNVKGGGLNQMDVDGRRWYTNSTFLPPHTVTGGCAIYGTYSEHFRAAPPLRSKAYS